VTLFDEALSDYADKNVIIAIPDDQIPGNAEVINRAGQSKEKWEAHWLNWRVLPGQGERVPLSSR